MSSPVAVALRSIDASLFVIVATFRPTAAPTAVSDVRSSRRALAFAVASVVLFAR